MYRRFFQAILIVSTVGLCWLGMQAAHELGHILHLRLSGGAADYVVLHPLAISYTHPAVNPHPLFVAWGGAIWGTLLPLAALGAIHLFARPHVYLAAFFAGFCLIANGAYLLGDSVVRGGDGRELIAYGTPPWILVIFGVAGIALGLFLWNGLGPRFGLGTSRGQVDRRAAIAAAIALAAVVLAEIILA